MHEYAIAENIIALVLEEAKSAGANKVIIINIIIGEISSVIPESVELYFEPLSKDTLLEGARLNFINVYAELKCNQCGKIYLKMKHGIECPDCRGVGVFTEKGREFYVESIEVD